VSLPLTVGLLITVVIQGMLGALTVTWQLKPLIVTLHLIFGITTLSLLWWLLLSLRTGARGGVRFAGGSSSSSSAYPDRSRLPHQLMLAALVALGIQVALGGWVSSNYAAVACPDFPKCQNSWVPEMDYKDAFVLWRGLGVNYEGGILQHPARVAIHYTHRLGAVVATIALLVAAIAALRRKTSRSSTRMAAYAVLAALGLQLFIGASMVLEGFPLALATAHNAGAALLVLASLALYRSLRYG
jgi:cytochrome c oxidase assembly protein subunit 15